MPFQLRRELYITLSEKIISYQRIFLVDPDAPIAHIISMNKALATETKMVALFHGTTSEDAEAIRAERTINGSVFLTPRREIAENYGEEVVSVRVDAGLLMIDCDLPDARLLTVEEANDYLGYEGWTIDSYLKAGHSVGTEFPISL